MNQSENGGNNSENISSSERILISIALFMFAAVIGYNAFYIFKDLESPKISGNIVMPKSDTNSDVNNNTNNDTEKSEVSISQEALININTASAEELILLKRIGASIAERIIEYREAHGGFSNIEEIMNVRGIGEKVFEEIKNDICV